MMLSGSLVSTSVRLRQARSIRSFYCGVTSALGSAVWASGHGATSVSDLAKQMGSTGASLYNVLGDKRSLYRRSLDHYLKLGLHERVSRRLIYRYSEWKPLINGLYMQSSGKAGRDLNGTSARI